MKKIFVYIGSRNDDSSLTRYIKKVMDSIRYNVPEFDLDIFKASDTHINHSTGCKTCFNKGFCPQDSLEHDSMSLIKSKLLESDFIILGSPVYSHNVSGDMKAFVDRLSYWGHLFRLVGKPGMVFASGTNGLHHVLDYQKKILTYMGVITTDEISVYPDSIESKESIKEIANQIIEYTLEKRQIKSNDSSEAAFATFKFVFSEYPKDHVEYLYWKRNGLFDYSSFQELLDAKKKDNLVLEEQVLK